MDAGEIKCRFGCAHPIGIYHVPEGCACWPDPVQALCAQHFIKAQSTGPIELIVELSETKAPPHGPDPMRRGGIG
jgi:hypothetical protein